MYWTFVSRAVRLRRRRLLLAFSALAVSAALATALFSIYSDIERKISAEFSSYGANLVIAPANSSVTVPIRAVEEARNLGAIAAPFLFAQTTLNGQAVLLAGLDMAAAEPLTQYWRVEGARTHCLAGVNVAEHFHLRVGDEVNLPGARCRISGVVSTGGSEDGELIVPLAIAAKVAAVENAASLVQVRVPAQTFSKCTARSSRTAARNRRAACPGHCGTESSVVVKMRVALFLLLALILVITTMSVSSNFSELVMERSREIGILKAIGAAEKTIAALFLSESMGLAIVSTAVGYLTGILLAGWISESVFAAPFTIHVNFSVLLLAAAITLAVAFAATAIAAGRIWRIEAATTLRGE